MNVFSTTVARSIIFKLDIWNATDILRYIFTEYTREVLYQRCCFPYTDQIKSDNPDNDVSEYAKIFYESCTQKPSSLSSVDLTTIQKLVDIQGKFDPRVSENNNMSGIYNFSEDAFDLQKTLVDFLKLD